MKELKQLIDDFLDDIQASGKSEWTARAYSGWLSRFTDWCAANSIDFKAITGRQLRAYRNYLAKKHGLKPRTINCHIYALKSFFDFLVDVGEIPGHAIVTKRLRVETGQPLPRFLTEDEAEKIFTHEVFLSLPKNVQLAIKTMRATGLRVSGVSGLTPENVILKDGAVFLRVTEKGKKERYVPVLEKEVAKEIINFKENRVLKGYRKNKDKLFGVCASRIIQCCVWVKKATGVDFHSHRLRHTVATNLLHEGVRLDVIQDLLGHADISTTRRYAATLPEAFFQIAARVS
ncbi:MAG: tyrosine-type recombinase/integrase [Firmicutes bacterium]|nr:tyrosine-type recombinase/integrase [Bacillota bacterium]